MVHAEMWNLVISQIDSENPDSLGGTRIDGGKFGRNNAVLDRFRVSRDGVDEKRALLFCSLPLQGMEVVLESELRMFTATPGNVWSEPATYNAFTMSVSIITEEWAAATVNWNNKPSVSPVLATIVHPGWAGIPTAYSPVNIDLGALMQAIGNGEYPFFGLQLSISDGDIVDVWGNFGGDTVKTDSIGRPTNDRSGPMISLDYAARIHPADRLSPDNGVVALAKPTLRFADPRETSLEVSTEKSQTLIAAIDVQISTSADMSAPWESDWILTNTSLLDLTTTDYPGIALDDRVYWKIRWRDITGQESAWSYVANMIRKDIGDVTITYPLDGGVVSDFSPTVTWDTEFDQVAWQVNIYDLDNGNRLVWTSQKVLGTAQACAIPAGFLQSGIILAQKPGPDDPPDPDPPPPIPIPYKLEVLAWDGEIRVSSNAGTADLYQIASVNFTVDPAEALTPVENPHASNIPPYGWCELTWQRGTEPDEWAIFVDGALHGIFGAFSLREDPDEAGVYRYVVVALQPRVQHQIWILPRSDGEVSLGEDDTPVWFTPKLQSALLSEIDGSNAIFLLNYDRDEEEPQNQGILEVMGPGAPVLVTQSRKGKRGSISGELTGQAGDGLTTDQEKARWEILSKPNGRVLLLRVLNDTFQCYIANTHDQSYSSGPDGIYYEVSFDYYQTDFAG